MVNKRSPKCSTWMQSQKRQNDLCSFQGKPFNITVIQVYAPTSNVEEADVERFYEDLQDLLELTPKKDVLFIVCVCARVRSVTPDSLQPHGLQPSRLLCPWSFPGKNMEWAAISYSRRP